MKKIQLLSVAAIAALMSLSACSGMTINHKSHDVPSNCLTSLDSKKDETSNAPSKGETSESKGNSVSSQNSTGGQNSTTSTSSQIPDDEKYAIVVNSATGVTYTLSKTSAKQGEEVTLTLQLEKGYKVKSVTSTQTTLEKLSDLVYKFTMPNRSVRITVNVDVEGDMTITGEIAGIFVPSEKAGVYVAKDIKVQSTKNNVGFDVIIKDAQGNPTKMKVMAYDESRTFADVQTTYKSDYSLQIASGATYDFYYDTNSEYPFYVIRKHVDKIPTTAEQVYSLFSGRMRSNPACHPDNLNGITYNFERPGLKYEYNYKLYENNVSYATVNDTTDPENPENYMVYKKADLDKNVYTVVNTWSKAKGNNENADYVWNLDPYKDDDTVYYQPYAAKLDITPTDTDNSKREISVRNAIRDVRAGAHYGAELEYEFYDTYRSVYSGNVIINAPKNYNLDLKSEAKEDGSFDVTISSYTEYDYDATANTADVTAHEGNVYSNKLHFLANGALETLDCTKTYYAQSEWDFKNHKPSTGATGTRTHFTVRNTFGAPVSGAPSVDLTPYFVTKINSASWYNSLTKQEKSNTISHINYNDQLTLIPYGNAGKVDKLCANFNFEPATALDAWQYQPNVSDDDLVLKLNANRRLQAVGVGKANAKITNGTVNSGEVTYNAEVNVYATGTVHQFFINCTIPGYDSYQCNSSTDLEAYAGKTTTYYVDTNSNTGAPCQYELYFRTVNQFGDYEYKTTTEYLNVVQTGTCLILDCNTPAALALTKPVTLTVKVMSPFYLEGWSPSTWNIRIHPRNPEERSIVGTNWIFDSYMENNKPINDYTEVHFTNTLVEGETDIYVGTVVDHIYSGDTLRGVDTWTFHYQTLVSGKILARIVAADLQSDFKGEPYYYFSIDFYGITEDGYLGVALWYETQENYDNVIGNVSWAEDGMVVESYFGFTEVK